MLLLLTFHMKQAEERGVSRLRRDTTQVKSLGSEKTDQWEVLVYLGIKMKSLKAFNIK